MHKEISEVNTHKTHSDISDSNLNELTADSVRKNYILKIKLHTYKLFY